MIGLHDEVLRYRKFTLYNSLIGIYPFIYDVVYSKLLSVNNYNQIRIQPYNPSL